LVRVANRAERAWSLIEVMLQRRHDLVPRIVAVVTAGRDHEADLQARAAHLRTPRGSSPGTAGALVAEQTDVLRSVFARAEAYPELRADESFRTLHDQLADTENRIAAARAFHNDSVTALRDRTGTFPGVLVARLGDFGGRELFAAEGFERAVPAASG
jgi:LemA protein